MYLFKISHSSLGSLLKIDFINLLERGCELEDIVSLIPEKLEKIINELKESAIKVLKGYPKFVKTFWVD